MFFLGHGVVDIVVPGGCWSLNLVTNC